MIKITVSGWWFGTMEFYDFPYIYIGNVIIPTDFHSIIFQRGRYTTNQVCNVGNTITNHPWLGMVYTTYKNGDIWDSLWHCFAHIILHLRTKPHPEDLWKNYRKHKNAAISSVSFPESQPWDPKTCNQMLICLICFFNPITNSCIITWICDWMCSVWVSRGPFFLRTWPLSDLSVIRSQGTTYFKEGWCGCSATFDFSDLSRSFKSPLRWRMFIASGYQIWLVVWNHGILFVHILGIIIPTDFHIFQRGWWSHQPEMDLVANKASTQHITTCFDNGVPYHGDYLIRNSWAPNWN